ncbi:HNH endonuclease [Bradyrhizobium sp. ma5]|uniref:HNH endonuclease n=1 Tax=Bradyrhizobium sp. ma5 TaxID=3344828 RepID=UPI0035D4F520
MRLNCQGLPQPSGTERLSKSLTAERLRELLSYDRATGAFHWLVSPASSIRPGTRAGWRHSSGATCITINGRHYFARRLAWLHVTGALPAAVQNIDGDLANDAFENLRLATINRMGRLRLNRRAAHRRA